MRVFVTGATGALGRHLVPGLVAAGHRVTATTRSAAKTGQLREAGAAPVVVDGLDTDAVVAAVRAASPEVIVHQMTALADLVAQSYTGWPNERSGGSVKTESDPLDPRPIPSTRQSLAALRHLEQAVPAGVPEGIALRYGSFYGPGASEPLLDLVRKRQLPVIGGGSGIWSFIETSDAAAATVAAVEGGAPGVYNIVDSDPAAVAEWLPYLAGIMGAKPPLRVPAWFGRALAGELVVAQMTSVRGSSNEKARKELGWEPRYASWREGFRAWVGG
jgi:nucleoside-diphosphate-sugar epimerase